MELKIYKQLLLNQLKQYNTKWANCPWLYLNCESLVLEANRTTNWATVNTSSNGAVILFKGLAPEHERWSRCCKTLFGGNLDFPKIKKLKKVCSDDWTCTKMLTNVIISLTILEHCRFVLKWPILAVLTEGEI